MNTDEYKERVLATEAADWVAVRARVQDVRHLRLLHAAIGLASEVGELTEAITAVEPCEIHILEELGDALWYSAVGLHAADGALYFSQLSSDVEVDVHQDGRRGGHWLELLTVTAGEILSIVKAWIYYGRDLDFPFLRMRFDMAVHCLQYIGARCSMSASDIMAANVRKLHGKRYKGGVFSEHAANVRDLDGERSAMAEKKA